MSGFDSSYYADLNIQTAGALEASRSKKQIENNKKLMACDIELENLLKKINKSNNIHLKSTQKKLNEWKKNKREGEIIETINSLIDYLNSEQKKITTTDPKYSVLKNRIKFAKNKLIAELKKIKI